MALADSSRWTSLSEILFQNYTAEQGIPHLAVTAITQDKAGFIWVGTQEGLARWDGYRFRVYGQDLDGTGALADSFIDTLFVDAQDRLWIGTDSGGIARYDRLHDRFIRYPTGGAGGLSNAHARVIIQDSAGALWIGGDNGLDRLDPETGVVQSMHHDEGDPDSLPSDHVADLALDRNGTLWVGTAKGLVRRPVGMNHFMIQPLPQSELAVASLYEDSDGTLWIGSMARGLFQLRPGDELPRPIETGASVTSAQDQDPIMSIVEASAQEIWLSERGSGIVVVDKMTGATRRIRHDPTQPMSLPNDTIEALFRDRGGSVWVGGFGGLSRYTPNNDAILTVLGGAEQRGGLSKPDVISVYSASDGRVWLGYGHDGLDIVDAAGTIVARLKSDLTQPETKLPKGVYSVAEADGGDVFIATHRGLYRADRDGHGLQRVTLPNLSPTLRINRLIYSDGILWVGSSEGLKGFKTGEGLKPVFGPAESAGLTDQRISSFAIDPNGRDVWVGTSAGLNRLNRTTGHIDRIAEDPNGVKLGFVSSLVFDREGRLWVGSLGTGILVLTVEESIAGTKFQHIGRAEGLASIAIDALLADRLGRIWASTDDGLAVIDPERLTAHALHSADGVHIAENWVTSGAESAEGELLFGGFDGLTVVRPDRLTAWTYQPPLVITDLRIGGKSAISAALNDDGRQQTVTLTPDTNSLAVEFSALDYTAPERNQYEYRLDGFDTAWIETDPTRRVAAYTNLPPGNYTLRLRGTNRLGIFSPHEASLSIKVLPAWYQTLWFKFALGALGLASLWLLVSMRTSLLEQRQRELEHQVAERTAALERTAMDLQRANQQLVTLASTDPLTGCYNRRHFVERAHEYFQLAQRAKRPISLLILDLDHFKRVNDTHGHPIGDAVLRCTAQICQASTRSTDVLSRMGGEEFALLMPDTDLEGATTLANRLREAIEGSEIAGDGVMLQVTASIGVGELGPNEDFDEIYTRVDVALYAAKTGGRNRVSTAPAA
jgi:diguanylate cyclase (GGDEF)-like protein